MIARKCFAGDSIGEHSQVLHQFAYTNAKGISHEFQRPQGHALFPTFESIEVGAIQPGQLRKLLLRNLPGFANFLDSLRNYTLGIVLQPIRLWRMLR